MRATFPLDDDRIEKRLLELQVEEPKATDLIGTLYETEEKALSAMAQAVENLSIKKWEEKTKWYTNYFCEIRSFYISREDIN